MEESTTAEDQRPTMHHREITLADGRYLIFYTFDEAAENPPGGTDESSTAKSTDV